MSLVLEVGLDLKPVIALSIVIIRVVRLDVQVLLDPLLDCLGLFRVWVCHRGEGGQVPVSEGEEEEDLKNQCDAHEIQILALKLGVIFY